MITRRQLLHALWASALTRSGVAHALPTHSKTVRLAFLGAASPTGYAPQVEAVRAGLRDFGYVEGKNLRIDFRWAYGDYKRLHPLATELAALKPDVLVTHATPGTRAAMAATATVPIVMATNGDAVAQGLVASLAQPGGNVTGSTFLQPEVMAKRVELLKIAIPRISNVAVLLNPANPTRHSLLRQMEPAAEVLDVRLQPFDVEDPSQLDSVFSDIVASSAEALVVRDDAMYIAAASRIATLAAVHKLPSVGFRNYAERGGLLGYGPDFLALYRRVGYFVDKIVNGAKPGSIPVEQATKFELIINFRSANTLGITLPKRLVMRADRVIE